MADLQLNGQSECRVFIKQQQNKLTITHMKQWAEIRNIQTIISGDTVQYALFSGWYFWQTLEILGSKEYLFITFDQKAEAMSIFCHIPGNQESYRVYHFPW